MNLGMLIRILSAVGRLRGHERWTRPQLEAHQARELRSMRNYAYASSPFYQRFHRGLFDRPLADLPVLTKAMIMENFDQLVTDRAIRLEAVREFAQARFEDRRFLDRYRVAATSGSSGRPGFFLFDEPEWVTMVASFARGQEWSGARVSLGKRRRMATVASISPWHVSSQVAATAGSWLTPSLRLAATEPLPGIVDRLNEWRPDILIAYASMARILAEEQVAGRLRVHPRQVFTSSEVLTQETRRLVKAAWDDEPFNQYGATETADIAAEHRACRHMHVFEDLLIVEVVDERNRPVPPGDYGAKVLVTTLFSRTQPLIRYELGDSVRLAAASGVPGGACPAGLPFAVLEDVRGRVEDTLRLPGPAGGRLPVPPLVFNRVMDILPVGGWQIVQASDDSLTVLLCGVRDGLADDAVASSLAAALTAHGARAAAIRIRRVEAIPKTAAGKAPLVKAWRGA